ncbi:MAG: DUF167 domain-containing protein [Syntrophomonadaceae bacterium]|jgi:uncharacterized protein (TIGR00251 family)
MLHLTEVENGIRMEIRVQPRSANNQVVGEYEGALKVKLNAPPVEGKANRALIQFLAQYLGVPKKNIILVKGELSQNKVVEIRGLKQEQLLEIINAT